MNRKKGQEWTTIRVTDSERRQRVAAILNDPEFQAKLAKDMKTKRKTICLRPDIVKSEGER